MRKHILSFVGLCLLLGGAGMAQGQDHATVRLADASAWPTVRVLMEVPGKDEQLSNYTVRLSDGDAVPATSVMELTNEPRPASVVVALDTSRSLQPAHLRASQAALSHYAQELDKDEQLALLSFNDKVELVTGFTGDREAFGSGMRQLNLEGNYTELYRAMLHGLELLKNLPGQRTLLVVTDGKDEGQGVSRDEVIALARDNGIRIASIGIPAQGSDSPRYLSIMEDFAEETGGLYRTATSAEELENAAYELLVEQRGLSTRVYEVTFDLAGRAVPESGDPLIAQVAHHKGSASQSARVEFEPGISAASLAAGNGARPSGSGYTTTERTYGTYTPVDNPRVARLGYADRVPLSENRLENASLSAEQTAQAERSGAAAEGNAVARSQNTPATTDGTRRYETPFLAATSTLALSQAEETARMAGQTDPNVVVERSTTVGYADNAPLGSVTVVRDDRSWLSRYWPLALLLLGLGALALWLFRRPGAAVAQGENYFIEFPDLGKRFLLKPGTMVLGTGTEDHIRLNDPTLSEAHASFCVGASCTIQPGTSTGTILLNGKPVYQATELKPGDVLEIGSTRAVIRRARDTEVATEPSSEVFRSVTG